MRVNLVGCSHHTAAVDVRERLAFTPEQAAEALKSFKHRYPQAEAVVLSTCNRVEIYTAAENSDGGPSHQDLAGFLAEFHGLQLYEVFDDLFERTGEDAVVHLFTVSSGLDSMVVGEPQILAQVKGAYELAQRRSSAGPLLHTVFQAANRVAKRVATETSINRRRVSIPSVAIGEFATQVFERFDDKRVLVIGAGEMGRGDAPVSEGTGSSRCRGGQPQFGAGRSVGRSSRWQRRALGTVVCPAGRGGCRRQHDRELGSPLFR